MNRAGCGTIAWIDGPGDGGTWGAPEQLALPLADRGLALADGLFETILIQNGKPQLLEAHLQRWRQAAARLGMAAPPEADCLLPLVAEAIERSGSSDAALRLNWSRGNAGRGIALPARVDADGRHATYWRVRGVPTHFVVAGAGNIRFRVVGYATTWGLKVRLWWAETFPA